VVSYARAGSTPAAGTNESPVREISY
jgi:hypothetical protein